jgi:predicted nucleic acid-binding protein
MTARDLVVDASVALKWLFADGPDEVDAAAARRLLHGVRDGAVRLVAPPHFLAEVAAVLARETPATALRDLVDLQQVEIAIVDDAAVLVRAVELAIATGQHVFDTLYHAIALEHPDAVLVTADERYWRAARAQGRIVRLADFATLH